MNIFHVVYARVESTVGSSHNEFLKKTLSKDGILLC